jgi:hypothetical protein
VAEDRFKRFGVVVAAVGAQVEVIHVRMIALRSAIWLALVPAPADIYLQV